MCITKEEVMDRLKNLSDQPTEPISLLKAGDFHGVLEWEVKKGRMLSHKAVDHINAEVYHTRFSKNTEVDWHTHGESSKEIIVCLEGELLILLEDGTEIVLKELDDYKIGRQVKHMAVIGNKPCEIVAMVIPKEK